MSRALKLLSLTIAALVTMGAVYYAIAEFQNVAPEADDSFSMRILRVRDPDPTSVVLDVATTRAMIPAFAQALEDAAMDGEETLQGGDLCRQIRTYVNQQSGRQDHFEQRIAFNGTHYRVLYVLA